MKIVHSFWFAPFFERTNSRCLGGFSSPELFWYSWVVSFLLAFKHYGHVELVTDDYGADFAINKLGLPYAAVNTELQKIRGMNRHFWNYGKLYAVAVQNTPFMHVDIDAYLWDRLPERIETAAVAGQSRESGEAFRAFYGPPISAMRKFLAVLPQHYRDLDAELSSFCAINVGIIGGTNWQLLSQYALDCLNILRAPENLPGWKAIEAVGNPAASLERCACAVEQGNLVGWTSQAGVVVETLLEEGDYEPSSYTHLVSAAKSDPKYTRHLEARISSDFPEWKKKVDIILAQMDS